MSIAYPPDREQSIYPELLAKVQTIGYRQPDGLAEIERIMSADPSIILLDIRHSPRSQNLQWTKTAFSKKYKKRYLWIKALGNVNHHEKGNIQIADAQAGIEQLITLLQDHNVLLMCGCESYQDCHRKVVYELLESTLSAKDLKATCFSEIEDNTRPATLPNSTPLAGTLPNEPDPQMLIRLVLDQEQLIHTLSAENANQRETIATLIEKRTRTASIIKRLRQQEQQTRAQVQARYHCSIDALLNGPATTVPLASFNQEKERRQQAEQRAAKEAQRVKQFRQSPFKPTERLIIDELQYQLENPNARRDPDGYTAICLETVGKHINMSASTAGRGIEAVQKQWTTAPVRYKKVPERTTDGREIDRLYLKSEAPNLVTLAMTANLSETKIKQGGDQFTCQKCGKSHVYRATYKKVLLICDDCGHTIPLEETQVSIDYPNASYTKQDAAKKKANACNLQANIITSDPPLVCAVENNQDNIPAAAKLLLAIAGTHGQHIEMSKDGEKKYYSVDRPLSLVDLEDHLKGGKARGSLCSHPNGQARALCFDVDNQDGWTILQQAAEKLKEARYMPLLEKSPADRGGHLWLISDNMMNGDAARERVYQIAPELRPIIEYWPAQASAKNGNRVRLPGAYYCRIGKHVERDVQGWCEIVNIATGESSNDGASAAALLLSSLTPVAVMAPKNQPPDDYQNKQEPEEARTPVTPVVEQPLSPIEQELGYRVPVVDAKWEKDHGKITATTLYFAIMPNYAAECYNREHHLEEIHPLETNGMALSPNGLERTASTNYHETESGERYTDHSQHGRRPDGTRDTGDALELAAKVQGTPKPELLRMSTGQIVKKARADLEAAARNGQDIPHWLEYPVCIITPAGRRKYTEWLQEGKNGERRSPDQLGRGSNNLPEGARGSVRVSTPVRGDDRDAETSHSRAGERISSSFGGVQRPQQQSAGNGTRELCEQARGGVRELQEYDYTQSQSDYRQPQSNDQGAERNHQQHKETAPRANQEAEGESGKNGKEDTGTRDRTQGTFEQSALTSKCGYRKDGEGTQRATSPEPAAKTNVATSATVIKRTERIAEPSTKHKIGTCLVTGYKDNTACGSTKWYPSAEDEYVCAKCLTPIAATRKIEAKGNSF